jgi:aspartate oxidase
MTSILEFDVLIIGSGLAGLTAALNLCATHRVAVVTKRGLSDGSSMWAQGGIAAVLAEGDSFQSHVDDTVPACATWTPPASRWNTPPPPWPGCKSWACRFPPNTANCT